MNYLDIDDTIIAQCTSEGKSSVDIVRISGKNLKSIYKKITLTKKNPHPNQILKKNIYVNKKLLDVALISFFQTPNSFTGEDVVEINCHGGDFIASNIIKHICNNHGVRVALPGEFSFRAYYYGKIDLVQAEAINDIVNSETNVYANKSLENINGRLSEKILEIKKTIVQTLQIMEHELDFNEDEITFTKKEDFIKNMELIIGALGEIQDSILYSNLIRGGVRVVLIGRPNAGKSSLFNCLMGFNRAIVSDQPGTTRDTIESILEINGYRVKFIDTAGYWESKNAIEKIGVEKTKEEIFQADLLLFLGESESDLTLIKEFNVNKNIIKILSKSDINTAGKYDVRVSSKSGAGVNRLLTLLSTNIKLILKDKSHKNNFLINSRQEALVLTLLELSKQIKLDIEGGVSYDIIANFLHDFLDSLNEIIDPVDKNDILNNVFANFCIGK